MTRRPATRILLSSFPAPGDQSVTVHQVLVNGMPAIRETESFAVAEEAARRLYRQTAGSASLSRWEYAADAVEVLLESRP